MNGRIEVEREEEVKLSNYASLSSRSRGRRIKEKKCDLRTDYQRDRDRIIHSKAFRRLKHKTQVFIAPEGDHFRTRLTHTLEVSQISRTIGRALRLNEDLIEAIALGHDLGHTPFGHRGESVLSRLNPSGFKHNEQSLRVIDILEYRPGRSGLNLSWEVREGILHHSGKESPSTLEGQVVRYADRIAYLNHDIDDAIRAGIIEEKDLPTSCLKFLGRTSSERIDSMIRNLLSNSWNKPEISMNYDFQSYMDELRDFMFERVYYNPRAEIQEKRAEYIIEELYKYYLKEDLPESHKEIYQGVDGLKIEDKVCDYIAGMTDRYVINKFKSIFIPEAWNEF